jgi:hypothetical protein
MKITTPRPLSRVKITKSYRAYFTEEQIEKCAKPEFYREFLAEDHFIFMGEIPNQPGHAVLFGSKGKMYHGFHLEDFEELTDDEV